MCANGEARPAGHVLSLCDFDIEGNETTSPGKKNYLFGVAASAAERQDVYAFRYRVYAEKMNRPDIIDADHTRKIIYDGLDDSACHFTVSQKGDIVGAMRIHRIRGFGDGHPFTEADSDRYKIDSFLAASPDGIVFSSRLIIDPDHRRGPVLNKLLTKVFEAALRDGVHFGFVHCSPSLVDMYERMGYRRYTDNLADPVFGYKVPMVLVLHDRDYLMAVRSPFSRTLKNLPGDGPGLLSVEWFNGAGDERLSLTAFSRERAGTPRNVLAGISSPILNGLTEREIEKLGREGTVLSCRRVDTVVRENGYGNSMFVVLKGGVAVTLNGLDTPFVTYGPGDLFGEIAVVTGQPRTASVTMIEDGEVFVFSRDHLNRLMKTAPELAAKLLFNISAVLGGRLSAATRYLKEGNIS